MTTTTPAASPSDRTSTTTTTSTSTSTEGVLAFFNTIPKCAEILSQPNLRIIHPHNPDTFFHSTLRTNNGILKSVFVYQPAASRTRTSGFSLDGTSAAAAANPTPNPNQQPQKRERETGYFLLHLGPGVSGQPDIAHGGFLATVLDQVTGTLINASGADKGRGAVTVSLNMTYKRPVRVPGVVVARAEVRRVEGRKIFVRGDISAVGGEEGEDGEGNGDGEGVCVAAEGMFLVKRDVPRI